MPVPTFGNAGTYGEGAAVDRLNYLQQLRADLESGKLSVKDYLAQAHPLAKETYGIIGQIAGKGSRAASTVNPLINQFKQIGFDINPNGELLPNLGPKYEADLRKNVLPGNTPDDQRALIGDIPEDIPLTSDRGQIEREGTREQLYAKKGMDARSAYRSKALNDLAAMLSQQADTNFKRSIPYIAEDANTAGVYRSTGYGEALARKQNEFQQDIGNQLSLQGIRDREYVANDMADITDARIGSMQSGLQRQLSLQDFEKNRITAQQFADANKPQPQGKTRGEKWAQGAQIVAAGGNTAATAYGKGGKKPNATA